MDFDRMEEAYGRLRERLSSGELDQASFEAAVEDLTMQDEQGRYWALGAQSGQWYVWEDGAWKRAEPPRPDGGPDDACSRCGQPVQAGASFCGNCGQPLTPSGSQASAEPKRTAAPPPVQPMPGPPPIQATATSPPSWEGRGGEQPRAASPPSLSRTDEVKERRSVPVAVFVAGGLVFCLLVAAGAGFVISRSRSGGPLFSQTAPSTATGLEPLVGIWRNAGEGPLSQSRYTLEADGRLRVTYHFNCMDMDDGADVVTYNELEPVAPGEWVGSYVVESYEPETGETEEMFRSPRFEVSLSSNGDTMTWKAVEADRSTTYHRVQDPDLVVLKVVNESLDDVWELRLADSEDPDRLDAEDGRLSGFLFAGDWCEMTLTPGTYDLTALDENDEVVAYREGLEIRRNQTWEITGGD